MNPRAAMLLTLVSTMAVTSVTATATAEPATQPATQPTAGSDLAIVRRIVAKELDVPLADVTLEKSMKDFAADELDIVEIIMNLEDELQLEIKNETIYKLTRTTKADQSKLAERLTVEKLVEAVTASRK